MTALSPLSLRLLKASFNADRGRARRHPAALPRRDAALLHVRGGPGGPQRLPGGPQARLLEVSEAPLSPLRIWLMAARPRTLPAAIAPVLVGSAAAAYELTGGFGWDVFLAALVGSIFIQIGTNLANDYSDAKRGADTAERLGPVRVTSSGLVAPRRVLVATWVAFGVAAAAGALPRGRGRPGDPRRRPRLDPRRGPLHRRARAVRLRGPGRGVRVRLLRPGGRERLLLRPARGARLDAVRALDPDRAAWRRRSSSSTTCATSKPTGGPARSRWPCAWAATARAGCTPGCSRSRSRRCRSRFSSPTCPRGACWPCSRAVAADPPLRAVLDPKRRRLAQPRPRGDRDAARGFQRAPAAGLLIAQA